MNDLPWMIKPLEIRHVAEASEVHLAAFPGFFLSFLGRRFLIELYRAFARDETSIALVAEEPLTRKLLGFAVGTRDPHVFFKRLATKRWWAFGLSSISTLAKNPMAIGRILRALSYRGDRPKDRKLTLLSSIAVVPNKKNSGLGAALLNEWVRGVREKGAKGCYLTTDADGNDSINRFYIRNGWRIELEFVTRERRRMFRYILDWE